VDGDDLTAGSFNDLTWSSGSEPKIKTGTWYFGILPTNPADRSASTIWIRWDYTTGSGAYQIDKAGTWHTTDIGAGKERAYKAYGREASNDDLSASLGYENGLTTTRWGEDSGRDDYTGVTEDTFMDSGSNDQEEGSCTGNDAVRIGYRTDAGTRAMRPLIKFDLTALQSLISSSSQIVSATLKVNIAQKNGIDIAVDAFRVLKSWSQGDECHNVAESGETTWRYQSYNSTEWTT